MSLFNFKEELGPESSKADVLAAVLAGKKVHKYSPAFPMPWTKQEIDLMADFVYKAGQARRHTLDNDAPEIPAVNYKNEPIN